RPEDTGPARAERCLRPVERARAGPPARFLAPSDQVYAVDRLDGLAGVDGWPVNRPLLGSQQTRAQATDDAARGSALLGTSLGSISDPVCGLRTAKSNVNDPGPGRRRPDGSPEGLYRVVPGMVRVDGP